MSEAAPVQESQRRSSMRVLKALGALAAVPLVGDALIMATTQRPSAPFTQSLVEFVVPGL